MRDMLPGFFPLDIYPIGTFILLVLVLGQKKSSNGIKCEPVDKMAEGGRGSVGQCLALDTEVYLGSMCIFECRPEDVWV